MFGLFNSITDLASNVIKVVVAPVAIAAEVANATVKPIAEVAEDLSKDIKSALK